ncbi:hypothetical protein [Streptomyces albireticuli]|uniref:Uncharacterized protein n=1 Tax=Streptomyces albireticuli TaxID=1940 RepID=A0A2A2D955_9ACTN|nr:hypothetical protein [Streptomyces albireticuli]MCD9145896.1 hypothetical protein [Streptomyces albireticuli]MCD9166066.1 hypothetical protein [Streptomyces albireticuli]MCD9196346.1 hypothetical protein [Streptomyces albireticuli]PAU47966.1 hypothetical protein CK936_15770 [Streptomyces albireticuli]
MTTAPSAQALDTTMTALLAEAVGNAVFNLNLHTRAHPPARPGDVYRMLGSLVDSAQRQAVTYEQTAAAMALMYPEGRLQSEGDVTEHHVRQTIDALNAAAHHARQLDNALGRAQAGLFELTDGDANA